MTANPSGWCSSGTESREVHCRAPTVCALTDTGPLRPVNEDRVYVSARGDLLIVADGLGGHAAGEVASRLAVDTLRDHLETTVLAATPPGEGAIGPALAAGFQAAHQAVLAAAAAQTERRGMGTTLLAAVCRGADLYLAHVGSLAHLTRRRGAGATRRAAGGL
jgi:protein phosphatase